MLSTHIMRALCFLLLMIASGCYSNALNQQQIQSTDQPQSVILLIGDGMGLTQLSTIYYSDTQNIHFNRFKHIGLIKTSSSREKVTDSASSATAYSTGIKTYNGAIGVDPDQNRVETIIERVNPQQINTGLVATSSITHATPAAFYAHVPLRGQQEEIAGFMADSGVDFFAGGGLKFFTARADGQNLYTHLEREGFVMDSTSLNLSSELVAGRQYGYLLAEDGMPPYRAGRGNFLPDATSRAIEHLSNNDDPFFLMIEGSQIDWGGHGNDYEYVATELEDFHNAIGLSLDFAEEQGNTLVIVTGDHETGGLALSASQTYAEIQPTFSTGGHTATLIPVLAYGPGAEVFAGIYENNEIHSKILHVTGW